MCINWLIWFYYSQELKDLVSTNLQSLWIERHILHAFINEDFSLFHTSILSFCDTYKKLYISLCYTCTYKQFSLCAIHMSSSLCAIYTNSSFFVLHIWAVLSLCDTYEQFSCRRIGASWSMWRRSTCRCQCTSPRTLPGRSSSRPTVPLCSSSGSSQESRHAKKIHLIKQT